MKEITKTDNYLPSFDLAGILPDLDEMEVMPIDLTEDYWTPEKPGESKRVFFKGVKEVEKKDEATGEPYLAEVAYFIEQQADGSHKQITNQSFKLVSTVKSLESGTPLQVTYLGKKRTQTGNQMDSWHVSPLIPKKNAYDNLKNQPQEDDDDIFGEVD